MLPAMKYASLFYSGLFLLVFSSIMNGQNDKALLRELAAENQKSVEALALYPSETRLAILEAAKYPEVLIKMNNTRQKTAAAYRTLVEDFPRPTQEVFYNIARYPGMTQELTVKQESPAAIREVLRQMPEKERADAYDVVQNQMRTLLKINELELTARRTFEDLIYDYPPSAQAAFRQLVELPEVLDILNEDLRFTILVGDVYRSNPAWVIHKTDSLNLAVARNHAEELDEWKSSIENDPEAQQELEAAAGEYAREYGYDTDDYYVADDIYYDDYLVRHHAVVTYHYSWWFGYPWWYPEPIWRPYPWWYHSGFYHHPQFVVVYMPSWHFMHWYFDRPQHHQHYSHLSSHFVNHYYGYRHSGTSISMGVGAWHERNRSIISEEWLSDRGRLPERMKEYGRFEESRQEYNGRNPKSPVAPEIFLEKNAAKYPELNRGRAQAADEVKRERETQPAKPSEWAPRKETSPAIPKTEPAREPKTEPAAKPKTERPPRIQPTVPSEPKEKPQPPKTDKPRTEPANNRPVEKANDYHRQKWEESRKEETQRERQPAPAPKVQPQRQEPKPRTDNKAKEGRREVN